MKSFLSIVILFLSVNCWGQKDTLPLTDTGMIIICEYDDSALTEAYRKWGVPFPDAADTLPPTDTLGEDLYYDTTKVIMLICDTVLNKEFSGNVIQWQYGYVSHIFYHHDMGGRVNGGAYTYYLDDKKKRLSKNIIVWQAIEIK